MAKLLPLNGKYYGTQIQLADGSTLKIWIENWEPGYRPSDRWLQYDPEWSAVESGYDHVEHQRCYEACLGFVEVLNKLGL